MGIMAIGNAKLPMTSIGGSRGVEEEGVVVGSSSSILVVVY